MASALAKPHLGPVMSKRSATIWRHAPSMTSAAWHAAAAGCACPSPRPAPDSPTHRHTRPTNEAAGTRTGGRWKVADRLSHRRHPRRHRRWVQQSRTSPPAHEPTWIALADGNHQQIEAISGVIGVISLIPRPGPPVRSSAPTSLTACTATSAASVVTAIGMTCWADCARIRASGHGHSLPWPRRSRRVAHYQDEDVQQQER